MTESKDLKPLVELVLVSEIVLQSKLAEHAADRLVKASEPIEVWGAIQSILVAAANVSKILWPARESDMARGYQLRRLINIDDHHLLSNRKFRNHFEHYDERIEKWLDRNNNAIYMDLRIDPFEPTPWGLPQFFHRSYNPISQILSFRDESIDLAAVLDALAEIREKCGLYAPT